MNNNDGFEEARRIIAEAQRFRPIANCCLPANNGSGTGPTGPQGPIGPTGPQGEIGPTGPQGEPGVDGTAATVTVGTTTTADPGTEALVTNTGTTEAAVLNFTIPQGPTGPAGLDGATGPQGEIGPTGPQGEPGVDGETPTITIGTVTTGDPGTEAAATITGTAPNFVLNLTIPQGPTGPAA